MATTSATYAILRQLDATLHLVEAFSPSLSTREITDIRQALTRAYESLGVILEERNLETEGVTFAGEFHNCSLNFVLSSLCHSQPR